MAEACADDREGDRGDGRLQSALLSGERRLVTVLFADVSGFTALSETLDPEALRDLITACFDRLVPCIQRYGGTIDKFMGDEIMALFGAPRAHENDPERALRAALEMRRVLTAFNEERHASLAIHFGVNTGLVYAGGVGGGERRDYSVMGDVVNVTSRLKAAAKPGEIVVGVDTYRQAGHPFEWEAAGSVRVKGKAEPVTAYRLLEAHDGPGVGHPPRGTRGISSPLVGRDSEVFLFGQALDRLRRGQGGIVTVLGEAGLGKSRLVAEVRQAVGEKVRWLEGRTLSFGRTVSYWPFLELLQAAAGIESDDAEGERWAKLAARATALFGSETPDILPYLATLLSLPVPENLASKVRHLDGEAMGRQVYRASLLFFRRLAQERPLVLVFEDVHWLDASSASLIEHLLSLTQEAPILFCFVSRPESAAETALARLQELARTEYADRLAEIALTPLSAEESAVLVRNLVRVDELPARLRDAVLKKAEGNPFFVEEVIRSLIDFGGLTQDPATGRWLVTDEATRITIPGTLQGVIMARIDRLDDDLKQVLRLASVVGRSFFYRVLESVAEAERELDKSLAGLEARELVREKARDPELEYIFKHALVQEATYESILLQRRKELHRRVAAAIEGLFSDRLDEFLGLLAYHYSKAEDWEKAQEYLFKAGDQAGSIAADAEALAHYEEAVAAYGQAFGDTWDPLQRGTLERKMGEALFRLGDHERAREQLCRALATLGSPFPESNGAVRRSIVRQALRQAAHRLRTGQQPGRCSGASSDLGEERQRAYLCLGLSFSESDNARFLLVLVTGLNLAESEGLVGWAAIDCMALALAASMAPLHGLTRVYAFRSLKLAEQGGEPLPRGYALSGVGWYEYWIAGDWALATEYLERAIEAFTAAGDVRSLGLAVDQSVRFLVDRGELIQALALAGWATQGADETGDRVAKAWGQMDAGEALYAMGRLDDAEANLLSAIASLDEPAPANAMKSGTRLALLYVKQGRLAEARALVEKYLGVARANGLRGHFMRVPLTAAAAVALATAVEAEGGPSLATAMGEAKAACRALVKHQKFDIAAGLPGYRMQGTYEWLCGRPRKAERWWRRSLDHAEKLGARYEEALTRLEIGRRLGDRVELERAEAEFAEMGAAFDLAEARRLLGREEVVPGTETASEAREALVGGESDPDDDAR